MANNEILSSAIFKPTRNGQTSTGAAAQAVTNYLVPYADTAYLDTDTGAYIDVNNVDASKFVIMYGSSDTAFFYVRSDFSQFSGKDMFTETTGLGTGDTFSYLRGLKLATTGESTGGLVYMAGPFETAAFKDTNGHINFEKTTEAGSTTHVFITPILLP